MSLRSDASMHHPVKFKSGDTKTDLRYTDLRYIFIYCKYVARRGIIAGTRAAVGKTAC